MNVGAWSNPMAYYTARLLGIVSGLPDDEYYEVLEALRFEDNSDIVVLHVGAFNMVVYAWAMFEEECRGRGRCRNPYLPDGVEPNQAASFFNEEVRRVVVQACVDLAPDWVVPSWVKWAANRYGIDLSVLKQLSWGQLLARLADYSVYMWALRGLTAGYLEYFQLSSMEYATVVASHVHWEIVEAAAEPLEAALEPLRRRFSYTLEAVRKRAFDAAVRFAESGGSERLGLAEALQRATRELRDAIIDLLEKEREVERLSAE